MGAHSQLSKHGLTVSWNRTEERTGGGRAFGYAWIVLCLGLILAKFAHSLALSWILILAPIWVPAIACVSLLLGAMLLDNLRE
jgi:hypothetical protein